jgi:hypothetical protein
MVARGTELQPNLPFANGESREVHLRASQQEVKDSKFAASAIPVQPRVTKLKFNCLGYMAPVTRTETINLAISDHLKKQWINSDSEYK